MNSRISRICFFKISEINEKNTPFLLGFMHSSKFYWNSSRASLITRIEDRSVEGKIRSSAKIKGVIFCSLHWGSYLNKPNARTLNLSILLKLSMAITKRLGDNWSPCLRPFPPLKVKNQGSIHCYWESRSSDALLNPLNKPSWKTWSQ